MISGREKYHRAIEMGGPAPLPVSIGGNFVWLYERSAGRIDKIEEFQALFPDIQLGGLG